MTYDAKVSLPATAQVSLMSVVSDVAALFASAGVTTEVVVGEEYAEQEGNANRVVFIPEPDTGTIAEAPMRMGAFGAARIEFGCRALVWGVDGDSAVRFSTAEQIVKNVIVALQEVGGDRVALKRLSRDEDPRDVHYGEQYRQWFTVTYQVNRGTNLQPVTSATVVPAVDPQEVQ